MSNFAWTDALVKQATAARDDGLSATQIAHLIGAPTRNVVIGKLSRVDVAGGKVRTTRSRREIRSVISPIREVTIHPTRPSVMNDAVNLFDVRNYQCRWPLNDPGPDFLFCGAPQAEGSSYCPGHFQASRRSGFQPGSKPT